MRRVLSPPAMRRALTSGINLGEVATLHELGVVASERFGDKKSLGTRSHRDGSWEWVSFRERLELAKKTTGLLSGLGVKKGDRVAVISKNRVEWATCAYGTYGAGGAFVPMYEQQQASEWEYILRDSEASVLFVSRRDLLAGALVAAENAKSVRKVFCFDDFGSEVYKNDEFSLQKALRDQEMTNFEYDSLPSAEDLATLIYTSGTTGKPKGVELTHANLVWNAIMVKEQSTAMITALVPKTTYTRSLSILPWAHIFGQTCELHGMTAQGSEVALAGDATTFLKDCQETKPTVLMAVPALYNRIYDTFEKQKSHMPSWKKAMAEKALLLGDKKARLAEDAKKTKVLDQEDKTSFTIFDRLQHFVLDKVVLAKIRQALGGEVRILASGGAALSSEVRVFLEASGFQCTNGYGLTETSPVLTQELPHEPRNRQPGSIGRPLRGVTVKTLDDEGNQTNIGAPGEIAVSSPGVMRGYWRKPEATAEVLFHDDRGVKWFKTGDRGVVELVPDVDIDDPKSRPNVHIRIVGRIKEQYKLANGKYVVPTPIEEAFSRSRFISQVFLYGDNRPFNVALISPDWTALEDDIKGGKDLQITQPFPFNFQPEDAIATFLNDHKDRVVEIINKDLDDFNKCKNYEFPKKFTILTQGFNVARGMLTPKLSLRRNVVFQEHAHLIDALYHDDDLNSSTQYVDLSQNQHKIKL